MAVGSISSVGSQALQWLQNDTKLSQTGTGRGELSFSDLVGNAIDQLNEVQQRADLAAFQVASGQSSDLHTALVTMEEASLSLQLGLQVRNKVVEAYQEIMRMQV